MAIDKLGVGPVNVELGGLSKLSPPTMEVSSFFNDDLNHLHLHVIIEKVPGKSQ